MLQCFEKSRRGVASLHFDWGIFFEKGKKDWAAIFFCAETNVEEVSHKKESGRQTKQSPYSASCLQLIPGRGGAFPKDWEPGREPAPAEQCKVHAKSIA